jgi:DNA-binding MarR family transcriptional regulator
MADINSGSTGAPPATGAYASGPREPAAHRAPVDDAHIGLVELLFFAYRDFTGEADEVLAEFGFGRAHHRVLHFVNRRPGLRVADLLDILRITKQSLARVLKQLVDRGFITQAAGARDRRERRLYLTAQGEALATKLSDLQVAQIGRALSQAGAGGDEAVRQFLLAMIGPEQRASFASANEPAVAGQNDREGLPEVAMSAGTVPSRIPKGR